MPQTETEEENYVEHLNQRPSERIRSRKNEKHVIKQRTECLSEPSKNERIRSKDKTRSVKKNQAETRKKKNK